MKSKSNVNCQTPEQKAMIRKVLTKRVKQAASKGSSKAS